MLGVGITTVMLQVQDQNGPLSSEVVGMVTFLFMLISFYLWKFVATHGNDVRCEEVAPVD